MADKEIPSHHGVEDDTPRDHPNDTLRLLLGRSSCRSFADKKVPAEVMELILEAGIHAPTGGNLQPYSVIKVESKAAREELARLCGEQPWIANAPVNLLFCLDYHRLQRWAKLELAPFAATASFRHFWIGFQDTIIAAQNICTAADAVGLGSVYIGTSMECIRELRQMFQLPEGVLPIVLLCLGYPKLRPKPRRKLGVRAVVHEENYRELSDKDLLAAFDDKYSGLRIQINQERLQRIHEVCLHVHGRGFAEACIAGIKDKGFINAVQRYFGLHYCADEMVADNQDFLSIIKECGFTCFEDFQPPGR